LKTALVITGPTACGKSALAFELARQFDVEIISVDSAQVYQGMDLGTAKPSKEQQCQVPHHLIDIRAPDQPYTAFDFCQDAEVAMEEIRGRGRLPVLVGGTMLYLKALREGMARLPKADDAVRAEVLAEADRLGWAALHQELQRIDPEASLRIKPSDTQRLQRALEVYRLTGRSLSELIKDGQQGTTTALTEVAITPISRSGLHEDISVRFRQMLDQGLIEEVEGLKRDYDLHEALPAMKAVGYRQVWQHLKGELSADGLFDKAVVATRQLAKRQLTWLRAWPQLQKISEPALDQLLKIEEVDNILKIG